jgi:PAS domain S-box-containing protein
MCSEERSAVTGSVDRALKEGGKVEIEFTVKGGMGWRRELCARGAVERSSEGRPVKIAGTCWDCAAERQLKRCRAAQIAALHVFTRASSIQEAIAEVLKELGECLHMAAVTLWTAQGEGKHLACERAWIADPDALGLFLRESLSVKCAAGEGLPGWAWARGRLAWVENIAQSPLFRGRVRALEAGLSWGFAFPVHAGGSFVGVIELLSAQERAPEADSALMEWAASFGQQFGMFVERKRLEEERTSLEALMEASGNAVIGVTLEGVVTYWNLGAARLLGYLPEERIGRLEPPFYPPHRMEEREWLFAQVKKGQAIEGLETERLDKEGKALWVSLSVSPLRDRDAKIVGASMILYDISARRQAEEESKSVQEELAAIVESTEEWIWTMDLQGKVIYSNPAVHELLGYLSGEVLGKARSAYVHPDDRDAVMRTFADAVLHKKKIAGLEIRCLHKNGSVRWLESNARRLLDAHGKTVGFQGVDRDVTARKMLEEERNAFISVLSHEIKTPLASIQGSLGLLEGVLPQEERALKLLDLGKRNCVRLSRILQDLLDMERLESGQLTLERQRVPLLPLACEAARPYGARVRVEGALMEGVDVWADKGRLLQALTYLIDNGVKFSEEEVVVVLSQEDGKARIAVADRGVGIPGEFQAHVFEKFGPAKGYTASQQRGTGLSLAFCRLIIEKLGGVIHFVSEAGKGSTFYIDLPLPQAIYEGGGR